MPDKPPPPLFPAPSSPAAHPPNDARHAAGESSSSGSAPRPSFHRGTDVRDAMAEMAERAQLISQEAGTKIAAAMREVINAAAGMAGFAVESARDLVQYMVRRGQMTQDEADRLIREAEEAHGRRSGSRDSTRRDSGARASVADVASTPSTKTAGASARASSKASAQPMTKHASAPPATPKTAKKPAPKRASAEKKPAAKKSPGKKRR